MKIILILSILIATVFASSSTSSDSESGQSISRISAYTQTGSGESEHHSASDLSSFSSNSLSDQTQHSHSSDSTASSYSSSNPFSNDTNIEPVTTIPSEDLCECFNLDMVCNEFIHEDKVCYFYQIDAVSNASYCMETINYLILGIGDQCNISFNNTNQLVVEYAPECYGIELDDGIKITFDGEDSSDAFFNSNSQSISGNSDSSDSSEDDILIESDFIIFSICFDSAAVYGTQENGQIEVSLGENIFICDVPEILPNFCVEDVTTTQVQTTTINPISTLPTSAPSNSPTSSPVASTSMDPIQSTTMSPSQEPTQPPTQAPTQTPTFTVCESDDAFNVAFLMDESGSVDIDEWRIIGSFVNRIINFDLSPLSYVTLWEYATIVAPSGFQQFLNFTNVNVGKMASPNTFTDALLNNPYNSAGKTETWEAVSRVLDAFWDYRFTCDDDCDRRSDILFVLTDGAPTDDPCPRITPRLNQSDVDIVVIIVGGGGNNNVSWVDEISCLDVKDNYMDIFYSPEFTLDDLRAIEGRIRNKTCSGTNPLGPSNRPENGTQWRYNGTIGLGPIPTAGGNCAPNCGGNDNFIVKERHKIDRNDSDGNNAIALLVVIAVFIISAMVLTILYIYRKCKYLKLLQHNNHYCD